MSVVDPVDIDSSVFHNPLAFLGRGGGGFAFSFFFDMSYIDKDANKLERGVIW